MIVDAALKGAGDAETTPDICPVIGRGRPMGQPRSSVVVLVFVPKFAPRWEALLLLFNTTRAHTLRTPKHRSHYHYGRTRTRSARRSHVDVDSNWA